VSLNVSRFTFVRPHGGAVGGGGAGAEHASLGQHMIPPLMVDSDCVW